MKASPRALLTALAVVVVAAALPAPIASASGRTTGAATNGMWGTGSGAGWLADNPVAFQAWLPLKADHIKAMETWYDVYKADLMPGPPRVGEHQPDALRRRRLDGPRRHVVGLRLVNAAPRPARAPLQHKRPRPEAEERPAGVVTASRLEILGMQKSVPVSQAEKGGSRR